MLMDFSNTHKESKNLQHLTRVLVNFSDSL